MSSMNSSIKSARNLLLLGVFTIGLLMSVGYATLSQDISASRNSKSPNLNAPVYSVEIVDVAIKDVRGSATPTTPIYTNNKVSFDSELIFPNDRVTYTVTIKNTGTVSAKLDSLKLLDSDEGSEAIFYSVIAPEEELKAGELTQMTVIAAYNGAYTGKITSLSKKSIATINYVRAE